MSAVFLNPKTFTVVSANQSPTALASNLGKDEAGMVWRSSNLTTVYMTVQLDGSAWDSFALVGSNLRSSDTIRIRAGASSAIVDGTTSLTVDQTFAAWTGSSPTNGALSFKLLGSPVTSPFVRIDITSSGNPAGYVQASRLAIGKRVETDGVNYGAEQTFEDMSNIEEGLGYTTVDRYAVRIGWKVTLDAIKDAPYNNDWFPFLRDVGRSRSFVFIPDDSSPYVQTQAILCRVNSSAKGSSPAGDFNVVELNLLSIY